MVHYYLDLEVYSKSDQPDPMKDRILLAVICPINPATGKLLAQAALLKAWEIGEAQILQQIVRRFFGARPFDSVIVGFGLGFDMRFIRQRSKAALGVDIPDIVVVDKPMIDIKSAMVIENRGVFKGVKLADGKKILQWYESGDYRSIEKHALEKLERFSLHYAKLARKLK